MRNFFLGTMGAVGGSFAESEPLESFISFFGDSITEGGGTYINAVAETLGLTPVNGGVSGTALGVGSNKGLDRYQGYIKTPGKWINLIGINDIGGARTSVEYKADMVTVLNKLLETYAPQNIVLCKLLWCVDFGGHFTYQKLNDFNQAIQELSVQFGTKLCDFYTPFINRTDLLSDGLHPNNAGYEVMVDNLLSVI